MHITHLQYKTFYVSKMCHSSADNYEFVYYFRKYTICNNNNVSFSNCVASPTADSSVNVEYRNMLVHPSYLPFFTSNLTE